MGETNELALYIPDRWTIVAFKGKDEAHLTPSVFKFELRYAMEVQNSLNPPPREIMAVGSLMNSPLINPGIFRVRYLIWGLGQQRGTAFKVVLSLFSAVGGIEALRVADLPEPPSPQNGDCIIKQSFFSIMAIFPSLFFNNLED